MLINSSSSSPSLFVCQNFKISSAIFLYYLLFLPLLFWHEKKVLGSIMRWESSRREKPLILPYPSFSKETMKFWNVWKKESLSCLLQNSTPKKMIRSPKWIHYQVHFCLWLHFSGTFPVQSEKIPKSSPWLCALAKMAHCLNHEKSVIYFQ